MKNAVKNYFGKMVAAYGEKVEMDGRTWHF